MVTKKKVMHATMWSGLSIVLMTILRLGSSVVSSRMLQPSDFGVLAFALAMVALMDQLSYFGVDSALVQKKEIDHLDLDVAWTFEFVRKNVLALILLSLTPFLKNLVHDDRISWIVPASCLSMFISSFRNNGIVIFRRDFQFRQIFYMDIFPVIVSVIIIVVGLLVWPNIAVLLIAIVSSAFIMVLTSHLLFDHRPRFTWNWIRLKGLLSFGGCLLGNTIVRMIRNQGVTFAVGGFAGTTALGYFNRGRVFSGNIFNQLMMLTGRVSYPLFSAKHHQPEGLANSYRGLMAILLCLTPLGLLLFAAVSPDLIPFVLSSKWTPSVPFAQLFCVESLLIFLLLPTETAFQSIGHPIYGTIRQSLTCVLFLLLIYPMIHFFGVKGIILASIVATAVMLPAYIIKVQKSFLPFSFNSLFRWTLPALFSTIAMWFTYAYIQAQLPSPILRILLGGASAALIYLTIYAISLFLFSRSQARTLFGILPQRWQNKITTRLSKIT